MDKAINFLKDNFSNNSKNTIVVACSGGPDSMALLNLCITLRNECNLDIICAHVNHNVREESAEEQVFVENFCLKNNVIFECMKITNYTDDNFENEARIKRYSYFDELIKKYNAKFLLTAHHGDDLIETILMRITRGSTLKGYSGFSQIVDKNNYKILRPLIYYTKEQLIEYNKKQGVQFVVDRTNEMDIHTRNRYRKYVLPMLKKENSNVHEKFLKFSKTLLEYNTYVNNLIIDSKNNVYVNSRLDIEKFLRLDKFIGMRVIGLILEDIYQDDLMLLTDKHIDLVYELITSTKTNSYICLPNGINAMKEYNSLVFEKENLDVSDYEYELVETVTLPNEKVIKFTNDINDNSNFICRLDSADIKLPLIVRNRRNGDKMTIKGLSGSKKLKDIFINEKVSIRDRQVWPVVTDSTDTIVWLPGLKKSQFDKKKNEKYDIIIKYN